MKHLNLLPKHKQQELYYEDLYHSVSKAVVLSVGVLLLGVTVQFGVWFYLGNKETSVNARVEELKQQIDKTENAKLKQEIRLINSQIQDFQTLSSQSPIWSNVLKAFSALVPSGVKISSFSADIKTKKIEITGFSPTREQVIELYNNINSDKEHFKDIDYPLENVSKPANIKFNYTFFIQDDVLIPKPK